MMGFTFEKTSHRKRNHQMVHLSTVVFPLQIPGWRMDGNGPWIQKDRQLCLSYELSSSGITHLKDYSIIWKGPIPKKIKFFLWEFSHGCIYIFSYQHRQCADKKAWWIIFAPNWCTVSCKNCEIFMHLFITCVYAHAFWSK